MFLLPRVCLYSVSLSHGAMGWSVVFDIVTFPGYTYLLMLLCFFFNRRAYLILICLACISHV